MIIKAKKYITFLIVLSYLTISVAHLTHYHHISINNNSSENLFEFQLVQKGFNHSFFECPIINIFNSLHNLTNLQIANSLTFYLTAQSISFKNIQSFPSSISYHSVTLRAPPALLS